MVEQKKDELRKSLIRVNLSIPKELHQMVKLFGAANGKNIQQSIIHLLTVSLGLWHQREFAPQRKLIERQIKAGLRAQGINPNDPDLVLVARPSPPYADRPDEHVVLRPASALRRRAKAKKAGPV